MKAVVCLLAFVPGQTSAGRQPDFNDVHPGPDCGRSPFLQHVQKPAPWQIKSTGSSEKDDCGGTSDYLRLYLGANAGFSGTISGGAKTVSSFEEASGFIYEIMEVSGGNPK